MSKIENPFKYATDPELNSIFDRLLSLKERTDREFQKAEKIAGFATSGGFKPLEDAKIVLPDYRTLRNGNSTWALTKKTSLSDVDREVRASIAVAAKLIDDVSERNKPVIEHNDGVRKQVIEIMTRIGIPTTYTTYELPSSRSRTRKAIGHSAGYLGDLSRAQPADPAIAANAKLSVYKADYERWFKAETEADLKVKVDRDEEVVKQFILGDPQFVQTLMSCGVNVLAEVQQAERGEKLSIMQYCVARAFANESNKPEPDEQVIDLLTGYKRRVC